MQHACAGKSHIQARRGTWHPKVATHERGFAGVYRSLSFMDAGEIIENPRAAYRSIRRP